MKSQFVSVSGLGRLAALLGTLAAACTLDASTYNVTDLQNVSLAPGSSFGGTGSVASFINDNGTVVGYRYLAGNSTVNAFLYDGLVETNLGSFGVGSASTSMPTGLSSDGEVSGYSYVSNAAHAFLYNGTLTDLGTFGDSQSFGVAVNSSGVVVGNTTSSHAFSSATGSLGKPLGGSNSTVIGINDAGTIAGNSSTSGDAYSQAFVIESGGKVDALPTLGGHNSTAIAMNANGDVVGNSYLSDATTTPTAFLYTAATGTTTDLDTLTGGAKKTVAVAVNILDEVAGNITVGPGTTTHAFFYGNGQMIDIGTLGGSTSYATAINDSGWIVGYSTTLAGLQDAFVWEYDSATGSGTMIDLNTILSSKGDFTRLTQANDINNSGSIVGVGTTGTQVDAFLATTANASTPEPASLGVVGLALAAGILRRFCGSCRGR